jgi:hypothetical protein
MPAIPFSWMMRASIGKAVIDTVAVELQTDQRMCSTSPSRDNAPTIVIDEWVVVIAWGPRR